jgi:hypothetical protein
MKKYEITFSNSTNSTYWEEIFRGEEIDMLKYVNEKLNNKENGYYNLWIYDTSITSGVSRLYMDVVISGCFRRGKKLEKLIKEKSLNIMKVELPILTKPIATLVDRDLLEKELLKEAKDAGFNTREEFIKKSFIGTKLKKLKKGKSLDINGGDDTTGYEKFVCCNCQTINMLKDNHVSITVGYCYKCEHPIWNNDDI